MKYKKYLEHFWVVILELEAEILSELRIVYCSIDSYRCWEVIPSKLLIFEPNKGQNFRKHLARVV